MMGVSHEGPSPVLSGPRGFACAKPRGRHLFQRGGSAAGLDIDMGDRRITEQAIDLLDNLRPRIAQRRGMREVRAYVEDAG